MSSPFAMLRNLIAEVLQVREDDIEETTSQDELEAWDSVGHLNLMLAIEEKYAIRMTVEDIGRMTSVPAILSRIEAS